MTDRLAEIKAKVSVTGLVPDRLTTGDTRWLIAEVERLRAETKNLCDQLDEANKCCRNLVAERDAAYERAAKEASAQVAGVSMGEFTEGHDFARHQIAAAIRKLKETQT